MRLRSLLPGVGLLFLVGSESQATVVIDNGLAPPNPANVIDTFINEAVFVQSATTVELVDGGQIGDAGSERFESFDTSTILMSGGLVFDDIFAHGSSMVMMSGGLVNSGLVSFDTSTVLVTGGTVSTGVFGDGTSVVTVVGGMLNSVTGLGSSVVSIKGGQIGQIGQVSGNAVVTVFGSGFALDGVPVDFGALQPIAGQLTGVLQSGEPLDAMFSREATGTLVLAPIPEPSTSVLLGLGLLAIGINRRQN